MLAVCALFFSVPLLAAQLGGSAEYSLPFGRHVPESAARRVAGTRAWLEALEKATDALSNASLVQWGAEDAPDRLALVSAVFTPTVRSVLKGRQVSVQVRLSTPRRTVEDRLRKMLHEREMLQLRAKMLILEREKSGEVLSLIERPLAPAASRSGIVDEARIVLLAEQLEALWQLGAILPQREGGRWREPQAALPVLLRAAALAPDYAPLRYLLGEMLLQLDRPQDALVELDRALVLNPELAGALYARGLVCMRLQLSALAERDLSAALALDASHAAWWRARGALHMIRNETGPMCEDFTQACLRGDCEGLAVSRERGLCLAGP
ncbi:MAG: tetratricopeptide repeat protein [Deltaproteobacteria bacterium]|nr:tetratricopeptide repeat protein [Deltaproteobacteria bacterium]